MKTMKTLFIKLKAILFKLTLMEIFLKEELLEQLMSISRVNSFVGGMDLIAQVVKKCQDRKLEVD